MNGRHVRGDPGHTEPGLQADWHFFPLNRSTASDGAGQYIPAVAAWLSDGAPRAWAPGNGR